MNDTIASRPPASTASDRAHVASVADNVVELVRTFARARARLLAAAEHDVEWSAHVLLKCLHTEGPMRAGALAECLRSDPSTVSRQVAPLVKSGLLERRADPDDGRASLLVLTPKADAVLADHDRARLEYFAEIVADWSDTDLEQFAAMLHRFTDGYAAFNDTWITRRLAEGADAVRSNA